jgi:hypothetical protein
MQFSRFFYRSTTILVILILKFSLPGFTQINQIPFECACCTSETPSAQPSFSCPATSTLATVSERYIPDPAAKPIYVRVNFIFLRKSDDPNPDIQGNFSQDDDEHMAFIEEMIVII